MRINVIGLGYIGFPTCLAISGHGHQVVGTDINEGIVNGLNLGILPFEENGIKALFQTAVDSGTTFITEYLEADVYIITVPTPYIKSSKRIDASYIIKAVGQILDICPKDVILVIESTVSPGTIDKCIRPLIQGHDRLAESDIHLVHAPERILPGNMLYELKHNPRTIGADSPAAGETIKNLYENFCDADIVVTDIRTAEMTKVVENTYRDINIAFSNELAMICKEGKLDVYEVIRIANKHPRVNILQPGPGVGGHCISVDPWFLVGDYPGLANLILTARKTNDSMPEFVLKLMREIMEKENIANLSRVGLYGLTYKEDVDDVRESPTLQMLECMQMHLAPPIKVYDPFITQDLVPNQYHDFDLFLQEIDMIVIMVGHCHLKNDLNKLKNKIILDTKNICDDSAYKL